MTHGHRAGGSGQIDLFLSRKEEFTVAARRQLQSDLAIAARALRSQVQRTEHGKCSQVEVRQIGKLRRNS